MPLYEYACATCHKEVEILIRGSEAPTCPDCGGAQLQKLLSVPATPSASGVQALPTLPMGGGCGKPQCGAGRCLGGM